MGNIADFQNLEPNTLLDELVGYIEKQLPYFVSSTTFSKIMIKKKNEPQHSTAFSVFMMKSQDKFTFMNEVAQKGSHKIDVAVYNKFSDEIIFTIEAKILPTPIGTKANPRAESEYVYAKSGESGAGIQRFKKGAHGVNSEEIALPENGMIAYILENDFEHWLKKVNQWILDAKWSQLEKLEKVYFNTTGKLKSKHLRLDKSPLFLHHFWVQVIK